jgi:hypothetical protein
MNAQRRKLLEGVLNFIQSDLQPDVEAIRDEQQEYVDNVPDNLQSGERYERATEALDKMDNLVSLFEDIISELEDITNL